MNGRKHIFNKQEKEPNKTQAVEKGQNNFIIF